MFSTIGYFICVPFAWLLRVFYNLTGSYGVSLILFTLIIKLILLPFQMKSKKSMVRMNRMSGRVQEIQKKYANNQVKMSEEMQKLYSEEGVNPMGGCVWSLLPMFLLIALYYIIREPIVYFMNFGGLAAGREIVEAAKTVISSAGLSVAGNVAFEQIGIVQLINTQFPDFIAANSGWVNVNYSFLGLDLAAMPTDAFHSFVFDWQHIGLILIPVLSAVLSFLMSKVSMAGQPPQAGAGGASMKMMLYMMPLMSLWIGFTFPAALGVYWVAQSAFSIIQEYFMGKFYNQKLETEETARFEAREEDRKRRQEEARVKQEKQRQMTIQQQKQAAKKKKALDAAKPKKKITTNENGRVGERPYARGRAFSEVHYNDEQ